MKELQIKYLSNFMSWDDLGALNDFTYPWRDETPPNTFFKAYHDDNNLYFKYLAEGSRPLIYVKDNNKLEVIHSERVEIFFKKDDKLDPYYCFEIDPLGRVLDYEANHYRKFNRSWSWPGDLKIKSEISKSFYTVSGQFEKKILTDLGLLKGNLLEVGLYRGQCTSLLRDQAELKWISWVDSGTTEPDFHVASSFGRFKLAP